VGTSKWVTSHPNFEEVFGYLQKGLSNAVKETEYPTESDHNMKDAMAQ
jgi:hypothetical protein